MTVCACCLFLYRSRLRYLGHFERVGRTLRLSEYGFHRLLIERYLAVFGVHRQIGIGLVRDVLDEADLQGKLYAVRTLAVCLADLKDNLCGFLINSLLENLALVLSLDCRCCGTAADLDLGRSGCTRRTRSAGSGDVFSFLNDRASASGSTDTIRRLEPFVMEFSCTKLRPFFSTHFCPVRDLITIIIHIMEYYFCIIQQSLNFDSICVITIHGIHPTGIFSVCELGKCLSAEL